MTTMNEKTHCAWCLRKLAEKSIGIGIGPECKNKLPEILNVAICNRSEHAHHEFSGDAVSDATTAFNHFGDSVDLLFMHLNDNPWGTGPQAITDEFAEWACYFRCKGEIHLIDLVRREEVEMTDWDVISAEMRRKVAVMCSPKTPTKINLHWIDSELGYMMNRGCYNGPYPIGMELSEYAKFKWNGSVDDIPACWNCDMAIIRDNDKYDLLEQQQEIRTTYENFISTWPNHKSALYKSYVDECEKCHFEEAGVYQGYMEDIETDPMNTAEVFIGGPQHYDHFEAYEYYGQYNIVKAGELEWESRYGQKIFEYILLPYLLQTLPQAFANDWEPKEEVQTWYEECKIDLFEFTEGKAESLSDVVNDLWEEQIKDVVNALQEDMVELYG